MAEKLDEADVAVVPSSGMLYEALSMQVKVISGMYVDNQKNMYEGFKRMNAFIDAGTFDEEMLMAAFTRVKSFKPEDRKSTRLNSSHVAISYAVFCLKKKINKEKLKKSIDTT